MMHNVQNVQFIMLRLYSSGTSIAKFFGNLRLFYYYTPTAPLHFNIRKVGANLGAGKIFYGHDPCPLRTNALAAVSCPHATVVHEKKVYVI